ncbi:hypothetical protein [Synechococcus sp. MIT S1220]|uniref:hypothetical protein n=1 Tax=Synechococcus sp. MIT S1220 TaxID=3082549 RepID=UPI0039AF7947
MNLAEVLVSVLILGWSSQLALQGWLRVLDLQRDARTTEQALQSSDRVLLAARRLLSSTASRVDQSVDVSCRLALREAPDLVGAELVEAERAEGVAGHPIAPELWPSWHAATELDGLWLHLSVRPSSGGDPSWQRRVLFTAAGLGRCSEASG